MEKEIELYIKESGEIQAPPVVFLHGGGVSGWMWNKQLEYFSDYHIMVPDLPGHGQSSAVPFISINDAAQKVMSAVGSIVGMEKVILIGFSLGAQIVVEIISKWPEMVDSAIIISALVKPLKARKMLMPIIKMTFGLHRNKVFSRLQARKLYISKAQWKNYYQDSICLTKENYVRIMESSLSYELPASFEKSTVRSLILVGKKERSEMKLSSQAMVRANRDCMGYQVSGIGHGIPFADSYMINIISMNYINNIQLHRNNNLERVI